MKKRFSVLLLCGILVLALAGISYSDNTISGKVVETMNAGGYTYVLLDQNKVKLWVAVPEMKVKVGDIVHLKDGAQMTDFKSTALKREFKTIVFSAGPVDALGSEAKPEKKAKESKLNPKTKVKKAKGAGSYTVAEIYQKKKQLNGQNVNVSGKVVKVSAGIMKRNWIHLQDGTGDHIKGTHNLVTTSNEEPSVGDTVVATGTVAIDQDFGAGYHYDVIIENSKYKKQ